MKNTSKQANNNRSEYTADATTTVLKNMLLYKMSWKDNSNRLQLLKKIIASPPDLLLSQQQGIATQLPGLTSYPSSAEHRITF